MRGEVPPAEVLEQLLPTGGNVLHARVARAQRPLSGAVPDGDPAPAHVIEATGTRFPVVEVADEMAWPLRKW